MNLTLFEKDYQKARDILKSRKPMTRERAQELVYQILLNLSYLTEALIPAGSYRRGKQELGDLDFVVVLKKGVTDKDFYNACREFFGREAVLGGKEGMKKAQWLTERNELVDFYLTDPERTAPMLLFLTGSGDFNKRMRWLAKKKGFSLNQYGLFIRDTNELVAYRSEEEIFDAIGMTYRKPEDRE